MHIKKLSEKEREILTRIEAKESELQSVIDEHTAAIQAIRAQENAIREKILELRPHTAHLAEMKAAMCNYNSRNKYFPQFAGRPGDESKQQALIEFIESKLS